MPTDPIEIATGGFFIGTGIGAASRGLISNPSQESVPTVIRRYVKGILQGQSAAEGRVHATQLRPLELTPGEHQILVYTGDEEAEAISQSHLEHRHTLELLVEVMGLGPENPDETFGQLEAIARVVLVLVLNDQDLSGCVDRVSYAGRQWLKADEEAAQIAQGIRLRFNVVYRTEYGTLVPDEFLELGLGIDTDGDGAVDPTKGSGHDIEDVISVRAT